MTATTGEQRYTKLTQAQADAICVKHERLLSMKPGGSRAVFAWCDLSGLTLRCNLTDADFTAAIEASRVSPSYGVALPAKCLLWRARTALPLKAKLTIAPAADGEA